MTRARTDWIAPLAIALVAALAYSTSFAGVFVFDDFGNIVENPFLRSLSAPGPALWANPELGLDGRPVAALSFALDYAAWGLDVRGFHATNLALHALAGWAMYAALRRALETPTLAARFGAHARGLALAIALVWVAHPLASSAVTYVYQRCESLMALAFLLAFLAAQRALERPSVAALASVCVAGVLGAGCKEVIAVLPLVVLAYDVALRGNSLGEALRRHRAVYLASACSLLAVAGLVLWSGGHVRSVGFDANLDAWSYARTQATALTLYVRLALWPHPLVLDYGSPVSSITLAWAVSAVCVAAALGATVWALVRRRAGGFAGAWFFLILAPSSSVLPITTQTIAEHRMYLPLAALVAVAVLGAFTLLRHASSGLRVALVLLATLGLALATRARNRDYHSAETLWRSVVAAAPVNPRAHDSLADLLRRSGRADEAREHFARAVELDPKNAFWRTNYGASLSAAGDLDGAFEQFREAVRLRPELATARASLGRVLYLRGDLDGALEHLREAVRLQPRLAFAYRWLGLALADRGEADEAARWLRAAIAAQPSDEEARKRLESLSQ